MSTVRANARTQAAESVHKRDVFTELPARGRATHAEFAPAGPLLEYTAPTGGIRKCPNLYYGGESRAGL